PHAQNVDELRRPSSPRSAELTLCLGRGSSALSPDLRTAVRSVEESRISRGARSRSAARFQGASPFCSGFPRSSRGRRRSDLARPPPAEVTQAPAEELGGESGASCWKAGAEE